MAALWNGGRECSLLADSHDSHMTKVKNNKKKKKNNKDFWYHCPVHLLLFC